LNTNKNVQIVRYTVLGYNDGQLIMSSGTVNQSFDHHTIVNKYFLLILSFASYGLNDDRIYSLI